MTSMSVFILKCQPFPIASSKRLLIHCKHVQQSSVDAEAAVFDIQTRTKASS